MRRILSFLPVLLALCLSTAGCIANVPAAPITPPSDYSFPDYTEMEIYQYLSNAVTEDSSLEEMLGAFEQMCTIPVETSSEMFLYEVYSYESEGEQYLNCHIVRQVDEPNSFEFIQLHMDIIYLLDQDMTGFKETTWYSRDAEGFLVHIRNGVIYQTLIKKEIHEFYVAIGST